MSVEARIRALIVIDDNGCWLWQGVRQATGYGGIKMPVGDGTWKRRIAHRVAYETHIGPIPEGLELDHTCRVRHCVNPDHLEPVTHGENIRRSWQSGARRKAAA